MAPTVEIETVVLTAWPLFTAIKDGQPVIGGKLYSYQANTTTPKATYADPFLIVRNTNPVQMNDQGQAMVYLQGFYRLVLTDREGRLLWDIDNYEYASSTEPPEGGVVHGMTQADVPAVNGESVLVVTNTVPLGYRVEGAIARIENTFGASQGLQVIQIGDDLLQDGWGQIGLEAGLTTIQKDFRRADRPITPTLYTVLVSAIGGRFDGAGQLTLRVHWSCIGGWA